MAGSKRSRAYDVDWIGAYGRCGGGLDRSCCGVYAEVFTPFTGLDLAPGSHLHAYAKHRTLSATASILSVKTCGMIRRRLLCQSASLVFVAGKFSQMS